MFIYNPSENCLYVIKDHPAMWDHFHRTLSGYLLSFSPPGIKDHINDEPYDGLRLQVSLYIYIYPWTLQGQRNIGLISYMFLHEWLH